jgi:pyridinium-3,5-biscarboxylic acid mononucleotide synthase
MHANQLDELLSNLLSGSISREAVVQQLLAQQQPSENGVTCPLGDVQLDLDRRRRCGFPEVIFGEGKSLDTLHRTLVRLIQEGNEALATRVAPEIATELKRVLPNLSYNEKARTLRVRPNDFQNLQKCGRVAIVTAGTTDLPVAEEARETMDWMGVTTDLICDVGVAGPHRLPAQLPRIVGSDAVVVVAGMEAALPSVVAGHVDCPVIGVPTSVGYGANFGGLAALLSMINSCAANVVVVNIDAGFKGGYVAGMIARRSPKK